MSEYVNSGTLFSNSVKKSEKSPDYSGDALLDLSALGIGTGKHKLAIAGWKRVSSKTGKSFLSIVFSIPKEKTESAPQKDEDVPF